MSVENYAKIKILVIDDDEFIRFSVRNVLKKLGCTVLEAKDGNEGTALFKTEKPDVIITDMLMPDKEGLETIKDLRNLNPSVRIIAMSGGGNTQNMAFLQLAQKIGANKTLTKPFRPDDLLNAVKSLLDA